MAITCWAGRCDDIFGGRAVPIEYQLHAVGCDCPCHDSWRLGMGERVLEELRSR